MLQLLHFDKSHEKFYSVVFTVVDQGIFLIHDLSEVGLFIDGIYYHFISPVQEATPILGGGFNHSINQKSLQILYDIALIQVIVFYVKFELKLNIKIQSG